MGGYIFTLITIMSHVFPSSPGDEPGRSGSALRFWVPPPWLTTFFFFICLDGDELGNGAFSNHGSRPTLTFPALVFVWGLTDALTHHFTSSVPFDRDTAATRVSWPCSSFWPDDEEGEPHGFLGGNTRGALGRMAGYGRAYTGGIREHMWRIGVSLLPSCSDP